MRGAFMEAIKTKFLNKAVEKVNIYEGNFEIRHPEITNSFEGKIYYSFFPQPSVYFEGVSEESSLIHAFSANLELHTPNTNFGIVKCNLASDENGVTEINGKIANFTNTELEEEPIDECLLHVTNFFDFRGNMVQDGNRQYAGGILINYQEWEIQIQKRYDYDHGTHDVYKNLNALNNFNITHIIKIKKSDGTDFKREDIKDIIEAWKWTLNLSMGRHVGIPIEMGVKKSSTVYEKFQNSLVSGFEISMNWFPSHRGSELDQLFHCLMNVMEDDFIFNELKIIIHTYIESNLSTFVEPKIVLAQIALEKLSSLLLQENYENSSPFGINLQKTLSEKLTFSYRLPNQLSHLRTIQGDPTTGPRAINDLRNDIAHADRNQSTDALDKWYIAQLALMYVEKCTLHLVNYQGDFNHRIS